jgi:hypothetical protein
MRVLWKSGDRVAMIHPETIPHDKILPDLSSSHILIVQTHVFIALRIMILMVHAE